MPPISLAYLPASQGFYNPPLGRFLPALPRGVMRAWLAENTPPGQLILDPLGANPMLSIEAAQGGARLLVARNNPILWLLLEVLASAPGPERLGKALTRLLITRRGEESVENHLRSLYASPCSACGQTIQPIGFIWEKGRSLPAGKACLCPHCGDEGERPLALQDIANLQSLGNLSLHRARAFRSVAPGGEYEQESINAALDCYLPRALYVCMTLANRLEQLSPDLDKEDRRLLQAMLVLLFDDATSLWHWPEREQRNFQLSVPTRFLEKNLWLSLEKAPQHLAAAEAHVPITYWPRLPPAEGGICLYQRRLSEKTDLFRDEKPAALLAIFPRPNQAFWTLSALWSGWLWGRRAVAPMRSALKRRRYDWRWFAQAIEAALKGIIPALADGTPMFGLLSEAAPNHFLGLLAGANASGFGLQAAVQNPGDELIQCLWKLGAEQGLPAQPALLRAMMRELLEARGEPCAFQLILNHCLASMAAQGRLPARVSQMEETYLSQLQQEVTTILHDANFAQSYPTGSSGGSLWGLTDNRQAQIPLAERLEREMRRHLQQTATVSLTELETQINRSLSGLSTPTRDAFLLCLDSYADEEDDHPGVYHLKESDAQSARQQDQRELRTILDANGRRFGFEVHTQGAEIHWLDAQGVVQHIYFIATSCEFAHILAAPSPAVTARVIVYPGSRARWLTYRLRQDGRLASELEEGGWHLLKYRFLRWLGARQDLSATQWSSLLERDPPQWEFSAQMPML